MERAAVMGHVRNRGEEEEGDGEEFAMEWIGLGWMRRK